jgi:GH25 family lysozyme M1 (1,4-beta-N-acetylmuramidase)
MATKPQPVHGIDISHHQAGDLDFAGARKRGLRWVYHKATEGDSFVDSRYGKRREEVRKAGLPFGAYHFARPERNDAQAEARQFLSVARPLPGDLRPMLDLEVHPDNMTMSQLGIWADTFCDFVAKIVGVQPIIYTPFDLGMAQIGRILWRPRYNNQNTPPVLPWDIWQFSNGVFGVPNTLAGIGNVDLNVQDKDLTVTDMLIPEPEPEVETMRLHLMHVSLQFSDTDKQHTKDLERIFERAARRSVAWITGTEAGGASGNTTDELLRIGKEKGYRMWVPAAAGRGTDAWIGVREDLISGGWEKGVIPVIPGKAKHWAPKAVVHVEFDNDDLGHIGIAAAHYLTGGRTEGSENREWNQKLADEVTGWMKQAGRGSGLAFFGGDQNMSDRKEDTFFGAPVTSVGDELKKWFNTGHGPIDVIGTLDRDGRVSAAYWRVQDDKEFFLHGDHFLCEAGVDIVVR